MDDSRIINFVVSAVKKSLLWATTRSEDLTDTQRWRDSKGNYPCHVPMKEGESRIDLIYEDKKGVKRYQRGFKGCVISIENGEIAKITTSL